MKNTTIEAICQIQAICLSLNRDDYHVFTSWSPHVNWFEITVHHGGWRIGADHNLKLYLYTNDEGRVKEDAFRIHESLKKDFDEYFSAKGARFAASFETEAYPAFLLTMKSKKESENLPAFLQRQAD